MPTKKKNKQPKNAFYFYMLDFKSKKEAEGVVFPGGLKDVAEAASPSWKGLDPKSKHVYENMAERAKVAGNGGVRYTTQGQTFDEVDRERKEAEQRKEIMLKTIKNEVEAGGRYGLKSRRYYFVHVNHYGAMDEKRFVPCEVALLAYSIEEGFRLGNMYHELIANLYLPNGYAFHAQNHSANTHQCLLPPNAMGISDQQQIYDNIIGLMQNNGDLDDGTPPPVYTMSQFIPEVQDFFRKGDDYLHSSNHVTRIYPLEQLFYTMKNFGLKPDGQHLFFNGIEDTGFKFYSNAEDILKGDIYDYASDIACSFHEEKDVRQHCSRSYVIRWSYLFSDHLCANLDVKIVSERHTPRGTDLFATKITTQVEQLRLNSVLPQHKKHSVEATRELCGRGKPVEGRSVPVTRTVHSPMNPDAWRSNESTNSRCSSRMSNRGENDRPLTIVDHSQFQTDDGDVVPPPAAPRVRPEDAPLRAPKSKGKSSMLLSFARAPQDGDGDANPLLGWGRGIPQGQDQVPNERFGAGRRLGRGRGRLTNDVYRKEGGDGARGHLDGLD